MNDTSVRRPLVLVALVAVTGACVEAPLGREPEATDDEVAEDELPVSPALSPQVLRDRCDEIKETAAARGITNPLVIAGIANHETHLVQCLSEWPIHCAGPHSDDCGGPVLAGSGDGPCPNRAGGLGMFQFDAGNYDQTLAHYGHDILDVGGNVDAGIDVIIHKVRVCQHTSAIATSDQAAIDFINSAVPGTQAYEAYISSMASCYNGCQPHFTTCSHQGMRNNYKAGVQGLRDALGDDYWTSTDTSTPRGTTSARVGTNADGRLELFARSTNHKLAHRWQSKPNHPYAGWGDLGGSLAHLPVVGTSADGRLEIFAVDTNGSLAHRWQEGPGTWSDDWGTLGSVDATLVGEPAVAQNADGRIEVFVRTVDGRIVHKWQQGPNEPFVDEWFLLGEHVVSDPVVAMNRDGRLELFVRADDDALRHVWQLEPNGKWSGWGGQGGTLASTPFVGTNADGRLELFHIDDTGAMRHKWQLAGPGWAAEWATLPGTGFVGRPVVASNEDGRMEIVARTDDGDLLHIWQTKPNEAFVAAWEDFGDDATSDPQFGRNADGRLEMFVQRGDGRVWHRWQTAPNSGWSAWEAFDGTLGAL